MKLLHFAKVGDVIGEYLVIADDDENNTVKGFCSPGFHLHTVCDIEGDKTHQLPIGEVLVIQR